MDELRKMCEIVTSSPSDTNWMFKLLENQDILVRRLDAGCGRERFIIFEKPNKETGELYRLETNNDATI